MSGSRGSLRERESKTDRLCLNGWARARARACAANAVRVPAGVFDLVADSVCPCTGVILLVIGFSNLIHLSQVQKHSTNFSRTDIFCFPNLKIGIVLT